MDKKSAIEKKEETKRGIGNLPDTQIEDIKEVRSACQRMLAWKRHRPFARPLHRF